MTIDVSKIERGSYLRIYSLPYTVEWVREGEMRANTLAGNTIHLMLSQAAELADDGDLDWWNKDPTNGS